MNKKDINNDYKQTLLKIKDIAKYYSEITHGAGGQSMNLMDRHYGMSVVGKEILNILEENGIE